MIDYIVTNIISFLVGIASGFYSNMLFAKYQKKKMIKKGDYIKSETNTNTTYFEGAVTNTPETLNAINIIQSGVLRNNTPNF